MLDLDLCWGCFWVALGLFWGSGKVSGVVLGLLQGFFFEPFEPMRKLGTKET